MAVAVGVSVVLIQHIPYSNSHVMMLPPRALTILSKHTQRDCCRVCLLAHLVLRPRWPPCLLDPPAPSLWHACEQSSSSSMIMPQTTQQQSVHAVTRHSSHRSV